jgi:hypothetical protein
MPLKPLYWHGADFLVVKADRCDPLVVVPLCLAAEIAKQAEAGRTHDASDERRLSVRVT